MPNPMTNDDARFMAALFLSTFDVTGLARVGGSVRRGNVYDDDAFDGSGHTPHRQRRTRL